MNLVFGYDKSTKVIIFPILPPGRRTMFSLCLDSFAHLRAKQFQSIRSGTEDAFSVVPQTRFGMVCICGNHEFKTTKM